MRDSEKQKLLNIIEEQKKENRTALISIFMFAALVLALFFVLIYNAEQFNKDKDNQICVPKFSGFFQATDGTHAVAIFDTLNPSQQQLANEVNQILGKLNNLQLKGGK